jgi:hypothetical protein
MIASKRASSSAYDVSIRHFTDSSRERISRHTSTPLPSGSRTSGGRNARQRVGGRTRLADHLDIALHGEELMDAAPHDLMVVEEKYPDFSVFAHSASQTQKLFRWPGWTG